MKIIRLMKNEKNYLEEILSRYESSPNVNCEKLFVVVDILYSIEDVEVGEDVFEGEVAVVC